MLCTYSEAHLTLPMFYELDINSLNIIGTETIVHINRPVSLFSQCNTALCQVNLENRQGVREIARGSETSLQKVRNRLGCKHYTRDREGGTWLSRGGDTSNWGQRKDIDNCGPGTKIFWNFFKLRWLYS